MLTAFQRTARSCLPHRLLLAAAVALVWTEAPAKSWTILVTGGGKGYPTTLYHMSDESTRGPKIDFLPEGEFAGELDDVRWWGVLAVPEDTQEFEVKPASFRELARSSTIELKAVSSRARVLSFQSTTFKPVTGDVYLVQDGGIGLAAGPAETYLGPTDAIGNFFSDRVPGTGYQVKILPSGTNYFPFVASFPGGRARHARVEVPSRLAFAGMLTHAQAAELQMGLSTDGTKNLAKAALIYQTLSEQAQGIDSKVAANLQTQVYTTLGRGFGLRAEDAFQQGAAGWPVASWKLRSALGNHKSFRIAPETGRVEIKALENLCGISAQDYLNNSYNPNLLNQTYIAQWSAEKGLQVLVDNKKEWAPNQKYDLKQFRLDSKKHFEPAAAPDRR
jgi:hypothetical protein